MKYQKIIFTLSILGILFLLFIYSSLNQKQTGTIKSITYSKNKITIELKNKSEMLVIFSNNILNLKADDKISYQGKEDTYRNQKQIIIDKIEKLSR